MANHASHHWLAVALIYTVAIWIKPLKAGTTVVPSAGCGSQTGMEPFFHLRAANGISKSGLTTFRQCWTCVDDSQCQAFNWDDNSKSCEWINKPTIVSELHQSNNEFYYQKVACSLGSCPTTTAGPEVTTTGAPSVCTIPEFDVPKMTPSQAGNKGVECLPHLWFAHKNNHIARGKLINSDINTPMTAAECVTQCKNDAQCDAGDYNLDTSLCYHHLKKHNRICNPLISSKNRYHFKKSSCPAPYPTGYFVFDPLNPGPFP